MFRDRGYSLIKKFEEGGFQDGTRPLDLRTMKYSNGGVLTPEQRKNREGLVIKADTAGLIITNMGNFTPQQFNARFGPRYILKNDAQQESNLSFQDAMNFSKNIDFSKLNFTKANQDIKNKALVAEAEKKYFETLSESDKKQYIINNPNSAATLEYKKNLENRIKTKPKFLLLHGDMDTIVPPNNLLETKDFLLRQKVHVITKMIKNTEHTIPLEASSLALQFIKSNFN